MFRSLIPVAKIGTSRVLMYEIKLVFSRESFCLGNHVMLEFQSGTVAKKSSAVGPSRHNHDATGGGVANKSKRD
jgi:hypothetical protein